MSDDATVLADEAPSMLLEPLTIGSLTAANRVVFGADETNLGRDRSISDRHVAYYERRAAGGVGTIVIEDASVHSSDWPYERAPLAAECEPGWAAVTDACHAHGTLVLAGLGHAGGQGTSHWSQRELWAPSRVPEVNTREVPKWMDADDIAAVVEGFGSAARAAMRAGCDGVEVNAGQFSLVRQFLSGLTNQREDEWGDRTLFARRVSSAVRAAAGESAIVSLRLSCDELAPWAGITPDAAVDLAVGFASAASAERIDMLTVVRGSIYSVGATRPDGHVPPGFNLELTRSVRAAVSAAVGVAVKVVAQGSIVDVGHAERALSAGVADAVEMTRAQIADAELVQKVLAGEPHRIRPCTLCNQMCAVRDNRNPIVSCISDPSSGHETTDPLVAGTADRSRNVLVVGGGPAGLEAARISAARGHTVRLVERSEQLGGAMTVTASLPGRSRFALLAHWLEAECRLLGVQFDLAREVTESDLATHLVDTDSVAIIATGGRPGERVFEATRAAVVIDAATVLHDPDALTEGAVLVWDPIGGPIGVGIAELLATAGRTVHIATPDQIVGNELARPGDLGPVNARLAQLEVLMHRRVTIAKVRKGAVVLADRFSDSTTTIKVGVVIDAGHRLPAEVMGAAGEHTSHAGDCVAPRTVHEAVLEGRRRAADLG